jgi:hypothetical protein
VRSAAYERSLAEFHAQKSTHERDRAQVRFAALAPARLFSLSALLVFSPIALTFSSLFSCRVLG